MLLTFSLSTNKLSGHSDRLGISLLAGALGFEPRPYSFGDCRATVTPNSYDAKCWTRTNKRQLFIAGAFPIKLILHNTVFTPIALTAKSHSTLRATTSCGFFTDSQALYFRMTYYLSGGMSAHLLSFANVHLQLISVVFTNSVGGLRLQARRESST